MITMQAIAIPAGTWQVDPAHSSVEFLVVETQSRFTTVKGRFTDIEGTLTTGASLADWRLNGAIRPASVTTAQEQRDAHLRSADFLNVAVFPEIRFDSDRFEQVGDSVLRVTGRLTMQGQPQSVSMDVTVLGQGRTEDGVERVVISGAGELSFGPMSVQITAHGSAVKQA